MIGDNIRKIRLAKGLSMSALARKVSVSVGYLSDIEKGHKNNPSMNFLTKIADALNVPIDYLMRTSVAAMIEDKVVELDITFKDLAQKANVSTDYIDNLDNINALDENDYERIERIALALNLQPNVLKSALAKQETPVYNNKVSSIPSGDFEPVSSKFKTFKVNLDAFVNIPIVGSVRAGEPILAQDNIEGYHPTFKGDLCSDMEYFYLRVQGDSMNLEFNDGSLLLIEKTPWVENGTIAVVLIDGMEATVKKIIQNQNMVTLIPMSNNPEHAPHMYDVAKDKISIVGKVKQAIKIY